MKRALFYATFSMFFGHFFIESNPLDYSYLAIQILCLILSIYYALLQFGENK